MNYRNKKVYYRNIRIVYSKNKRVYYRKYIFYMKYTNNPPPISEYCIFILFYLFYSFYSFYLFYSIYSIHSFYSILLCYSLFSYSSISLHTRFFFLFTCFLELHILY